MDSSFALTRHLGHAINIPKWGTSRQELWALFRPTLSRRRARARRTRRDPAGFRSNAPGGGSGRRGSRRSGAPRRRRSERGALRAAGRTRPRARLPRTAAARPAQRRGCAGRRSGGAGSSRSPPFYRPTRARSQPPSCRSSPRCYTVRAKSSPDAAQISTRVERQVELLALAIDRKAIVLVEERAHRLERPGPELARDGVSAHVAVLDHAIAARRDEAVIRAQLGEHVVVRMVGVEQHEHGVRSLDRLCDSREHVAIRGAPAQIVDARMLRPPLALERVDREHLTAPDHVA